VNGLTKRNGASDGERSHVQPVLGAHKCAPHHGSSPPLGVYFMKIQHVSIILGLFACLPLVSSAAQDVQARFEKSLKDARSLTNVEIQMLETSIYPASPKERDFSSTFQYTYVVSGPKFRATCKLVSATQPNTRKLSEAAFNGTSFVSYDADTRSMTRQDKIPGSAASGELMVSPLVLPYMFLAKHSDDCLNCLLRFTDIASPAFAKGLILPKAQPSNGVLHISMPGLPLAKKPTSWKIDIDESGDAFTPKAVTIIIDAGGQIAYTLLNYTNLGGYQFPTRIEWVYSSYPPTSPPTVKSTGITTVTAARIPEQIADSVFNLDDEEQSAETIWDADKKQLTKSGPPSEACLQKRRLKEVAQQQASTNAQPAITNRMAP
jgi:hypothetical protein